MIAVLTTQMKNRYTIFAFLFVPHTIMALIEIDYFDILHNQQSLLNGNGYPFEFMNFINMTTKIARADSTNTGKKNLQLVKKHVAKMPTE